VVMKSAVATRSPRADTSGLILPSPVGPRELNGIGVPDQSVAPTATTRLPSAGARSGWGATVIHRCYDEHPSFAAIVVAR
jgi:hypothetical protein